MNTDTYRFNLGSCKCTIVNDGTFDRGRSTSSRFLTFLWARMNTRLMVYSVD